MSSAESQYLELLLSVYGGPETTRSGNVLTLEILHLYEYGMPGGFVMLSDLKTPLGVYDPSDVLFGPDADRHGLAFGDAF
jgi:hypothetical protein